MDKSDYYFEKLDSILDKELTDLLKTKRQHHTSWDNHVLTLSTAALGFSFTLLPLSNSVITWLAIAGIISFVISIIFTTFNYIIAEKGIELVLKSHILRRTKHDKVLHRVNKLKKEVEEFKPDDINGINKARELCWNDVERLYSERDPVKELSAIDKNNKIVNFLNGAKTYTFLSGVISVTVFSLYNFNLLGK